MRQSVKNGLESSTSILVPVPAGDSNLYGNSATDDILLFLSRHRFEQFTQRELTAHINYSEPTVRRAVDVLQNNDLVEVDHDGNRNRVGINRERLSIPDDPFLRIPQTEFQQPVKAATEKLQSALEELVGIVLYGSVARGEADRRSDIDLWVVVNGKRAENQREASEVERQLEDQAFDGQRYDFHVAVESTASIPAFTEDISRILRSGISVYETESFETLRNTLVHGEYNE